MFRIYELVLWNSHRRGRNPSSALIPSGNTIADSSFTNNSHFGTSTTNHGTHISLNHHTLRMLSYAATQCPYHCRSSCSRCLHLPTASLSRPVQEVDQNPSINTPHSASKWPHPSDHRQPTPIHSLYASPLYIVDRCSPLTSPLSFTFARCHSRYRSPARTCETVPAWCDASIMAPGPGSNRRSVAQTVSSSIMGCAGHPLGLASRNALVRRYVGWESYC
ncbi:hypothetical protein EDB81DRAFT_789958 [Dactylonectria macrodidyma]|uniref:Uncharacterized protein n=1 Tax=Dactylonectria macrodidyma TaxID=307937 RepID=A0A9P9F585_9HYPO|nr:hypothetical protein EDB81DRAFT_789958 [Dactylonectria macrodidyma]